MEVVSTPPKIITEGEIKKAKESIEVALKDKDRELKAIEERKSQTIQHIQQLLGMQEFEDGSFKADVLPMKGK
jgi:hypothetical protein